MRPCSPVAERARPTRPGHALRRLSSALIRAIAEDRSPPDKEEMPHLLRAIEACHAPMREAVVRLAALHGPALVPESYLFRPEIAARLKAAARVRARLTLEGGGGLLPLRGRRRGADTSRARAAR